MNYDPRLEDEMIAVMGSIVIIIALIALITALVLG